MYGHMFLKFEHNNLHQINLIFCYFIFIRESSSWYHSL